MKYLPTIFLSATLALAAACSSDDAQGEKTEQSQNIIGTDFKAEPKISYCFPKYITDAETRTIAEVFTGDEFNYGHLVMRSQPDKRAGMYFSVMFGYAPDDISLACRFILEVDSTKHPHVRKFVFDVPETSSVLREVKLGVTGSDWLGSDEKVNAWRLTLLSPSGKVLTQTQSWLWSVKHGQSKLKSSGDVKAD